MVDRISIEVLGPLRISRAGVPVDFSAAMTQRMLALLVARDGEPMLVDALAEAMWEGSPPRTARKTIQVYAHRLRRVLGGEDLIEFTAGGYRLRLRPEELDAQRFERLSAEAGRARAAGEPARAAALLDEALSLWRGEAYAGIADLPAVESERRRLEEARLAGVEARLAVGLELGHHKELLGRLRTAVADNPFREGVRALLMLALYRDGRRAEALEVYRETHRLLAEELGVEPMAELQRLHTRMLSNDPSLDAPAPPRPQPRFLPHDVLDFVGRTGDLVWLDERVEDVQTATVIISAIAGAAGIGKTALAVRWAHRVADRFPDGLFYVNLRGYDNGPPLRPFDALIHLLRCLGVPGEKSPVDENAAAAMFRSMLAGKKALVLLDNARTAEQIRPLLPGDPQCIVLVTSREKLSGLIATEGAQRITLGLLLPGEAIFLLRNMIGDERVDAELEAVARLAELCGRLPLALRLAAAHLADRPGEPIERYLAELERGGRIRALVVPDDEHRGLPAVFEQSYSVLPEGHRRAFRWLSIVPGADFSVEAAAALLDETEAATASILDGLASCHLLEQKEPGRYSFHDLIGEYARLLLRDHGDPVEEPRNRLFGYLRTTAAAADSVLAHRREYRDPSGEVLFNSAQAVRWMEAERANLVAALSAAAAAGLPEIVSGIAKSLYSSFFNAGNTGEWIAAFECAVEAVGQTDDPGSKLFLLNTLGQAYSRAGEWEKALSMYREVVEGRSHLGDEAGVARTRGNIANTLFRRGRYLEALAEIGPALETIHRDGETLVEAYIRITLLPSVLNRLGRSAEAQEHLLESIEVFRLHGDEHATSRGLAHLGGTLRLLGRTEEASARLKEALEIAVRIGDRASEALALTHTAAVLADAQRHDDSYEHAQWALSRSRELGMKVYECECLNLIAASHTALGRVEQAREAYESALSLAQELGQPHEATIAMAGLGRLAGDRVRVAEAAAILESMSATVDAARVRAWLDGPSQ